VPSKIGTKRILAIVFVVSLAFLCVASVYVPMVVEQGWVRQSRYTGLFISADELTEKPQSYYILDNPDSYVLEAIHNRHAFVGQANNSQIFQIMQTYSNGRSVNIEYNNRYYGIGKGYADAAPPWERVLEPLLTLSWIVWAIAATITTIALIIKKKQKK